MTARNVHVVLVGMMGAGKTTVGRRLAKVLGRPFVDADEAFIASTGRTIAEVFADDGEPAFRALESTLLQRLLAVREPMVVAAGGGVVIAAGNRRRLLQRDVLVVHLHAEPAFLASRAEAKAHRPLLAAGDTAAVIGRLYDERQAWYREIADLSIDIAPFHEWGSNPKKAMAEHIAQAVLAHESTAEEVDR